MFYSTDLLSKGRHNSLSIIWIAATLGPRSSAKKLSKKEVIGVNITKACEFLEQPPEPLALRLTSNLMVGVARVLSSQYTFHLNDVSNVTTKLKLSFSHIPTANIDMAQAETRNDLVVNEFNQTNLLNEPELDIQALINQSFKRVTDSSIKTPPHSSPSFHVPQNYNSVKASSINLSERPHGSVGFSAGSYGNDDVMYQDFLEANQADQNVTGVDVDWTLDLEGVGGSRMSGIDFGESLVVDGMTGFGADDIMMQDVVPVVDGVGVVRREKRRRGVKLVDAEIEIPAVQLAQVKEQTDQVLNAGEARQRRKKLLESRAEFVKKRFADPSLIHNPILLSMYKKLVKPVEKTQRPKRDSTEAFGIEAPRHQDPHDQETGFGNPSLDYGDLEVGRDAQVEAPWAHTPSLSRQSGISYSGGDQFSFEKMRVYELEKTQITTDTDDFSPASEKETVKFYNYVKDIMNKADTETVYLFDLVQRGGGKRVASQAFYHLLVLATRGEIRVDQDKAFGDVEVTIHAVM